MSSLNSSQTSPLYDGLLGKGKEKEPPPELPPLSFGNELNSQDTWFSLETLGPSTYTTTYSPPHRDDCLPEASSSTSPSSVATLPCTAPNTTSTPDLTRLPSRCRSLSSLSVQSHASSSISAKLKSKFALPRTPSNLTRKLLFGKRDDLDDLSPPITVDVEPCAWYTVPNPISLQSHVITAAGTNRLSSPSRTSFSKGKGRSNSSPHPFSALDFVPATRTDVFEPIPIIIRNYFDEVLPRELRLQILQALVELHALEHQLAVTDGRWTMAKASSSKGRWVGRDKGIRELVKLSRVSKSWKALVFDGQMWADLHLHSFPGLPVLPIAQRGGPFVRSLNLAGHVNLNPTDLIEVADHVSFRALEEPLPYTHLTHINLQGCTAISTRSFHHLLTRSIYLRKLCVKGLGAVTNTTYDILANYCPGLISLNMSRCPNMDAAGIERWATGVVVRNEHLQVKELRLSGIKNVSDSMMAALGRAAPHLEVLDLSYARQLHNSALEAFVACEEYGHFGNLGVETVIVTSRDLGREVNDSNRYRRRTTNLRHLCLSFCLMLSDTACSNLSHSVPKLEYLELAGIGGVLKDAGLIRLLKNTPYIRRLDLEDATDITDAVLAELTPAVVPEGPQSEFQVGHALQHLILSHAANITDAAVLALIRSCCHLTVLHLDNTAIKGAVLREFVALNRQRKAINSKIVAVDCRGIGEGLVKELSVSTRPRMGWRSYAARKLMFLDSRDETEDLGVGQDECDEHRVVLKTFYSWQTVDAVRLAREKRRKLTSKRGANVSSNFGYDDSPPRGGTTRWWTPGGRRAGSIHNSSPTHNDMNTDNCRIM